MSDDDGLSAFLPDSDDSSMEIVVETLTGTTFGMTVSPEDTIHAIKSKIQRVEGIPVSQQHLLYRLQELDNDARLCEQGVGPGSTLRLVLSMRGGPVSTRRLAPREHQLAWRELKEYVDHTRENMLDKLPPGSKVTVLVFRDGDNINLIRVIEHEDGTCYPYTDLGTSPPSPSRLGSFTFASPSHTAQAKHLKDRTSENNSMMLKVIELRRKMEELATVKKAKKPTEDAKVEVDTTALKVDTSSAPLPKGDAGQTQKERKNSVRLMDKNVQEILRLKNAEDRAEDNGLIRDGSDRLKMKKKQEMGRTCTPIPAPRIAILEEDSEGSLTKKADFQPPSPISVSSGDANAIAMSPLPTVRHLVHLTRVLRPKTTPDSYKSEETRELCEILFKDAAKNSGQVSGAVKLNRAVKLTLSGRSESLDYNAGINSQEDLSKKLDEMHQLNSDSNFDSGPSLLEAGSGSSWSKSRLEGLPKKLNFSKESDLNVVADHADFISDYLNQRIASDSNENNGSKISATCTENDLSRPGSPFDSLNTSFESNINFVSNNIKIHPNNLNQSVSDLNQRSGLNVSLPQTESDTNPSKRFDPSAANFKPSNKSAEPHTGIKSRSNFGSSKNLGSDNINRSFNHIIEQNRVTSSSGNNLIRSPRLTIRKLGNLAPKLEDLDHLLGRRLNDTFTDSSTRFNERLSEDSSLPQLVKERRAKLFGRRAGIAKNLVDLHPHPDKYGYSNPGYVAHIEKIQNDLFKQNPESDNKNSLNNSDMQPFKLRPVRLRRRRSVSQQDLTTIPSDTKDMEDSRFGRHLGHSGLKLTGSQQDLTDLQEATGRKMDEGFAFRQGQQRVRAPGQELRDSHLERNLRGRFRRSSYFGDELQCGEPFSLKEQTFRKNQQQFKDSNMRISPQEISKDREGLQEQSFRHFALGDSDNIEGRLGSNPFGLELENGQQEEALPTLRNSSGRVDGYNLYGQELKGAQKEVPVRQDLKVLRQTQAPRLQNRRSGRNYSNNLSEQELEDGQQQKVHISPDLRLLRQAQALKKLKDSSEELHIGLLDNNLEGILHGSNSFEQELEDDQQAEMLIPLGLRLLQKLRSANQELRIAHLKNASTGNPQHDHGELLSKQQEVVQLPQKQRDSNRIPTSVRFFPQDLGQQEVDSVQEQLLKHRKRKDSVQELRSGPEKLEEQDLRRLPHSFNSAFQIEALASEKSKDSTFKSRLSPQESHLIRSWSTHKLSPATTSLSSALPAVVERKPARTKCAFCNKRLNITTIHTCRCGGIFCAQHRYAEVHRCHYDYKTEGRKILEQANPLVAAPKLPKI